MKYALSKAARLQVSEKREVITANSVSRTPKVLSQHALFVLLFFLDPKTLEEALEELQQYFELEVEDFQESVDILIAENILTPIDTEISNVALANGGFANIPVQHHMLRDTLRVLSYKAAISKHSAGKRALEIGCGTGILSIFAAQAGAEQVYAIEESQIADLAQRMFDANGFHHTIELKRGNSKDISIEEPVDLIIHEILGEDPIAENILPFIDDARKRFLKTGGRLLPFRLEILCRGIEMDNYDSSLFEANEFAATMGINMTPYIDEIKKQKPTSFRKKELRNFDVITDKILSEESLLYDINFYNPPENLYAPIKQNLHFQRSGNFNGVVLYFRAHLDESIILTNSPLSTPTHWNYIMLSLDQTYRVKIGDTLPVIAKIQTGKDGLERVQITINEDN